MNSGKIVEKSIHSGHRDRVRDKILSRNSFDSMLDHEILEFLLFQSIPRGDTNPLAHRLIDKFGSLNKVLEASPIELMQVEGVGKSTAIHLATYLEVTKRYLVGLVDQQVPFKSTKQIIELVQSLCMGNRYECAYAIYLDKSKRLIKADKLSEGSIDTTGIYVDRIVENALLYKAYYVVLGHNHTSGNVFPSPQDILNTERLMNSLMSVRKYLLDSVIVDRMSSYSMLDKGIISENYIISPYEKDADVRLGE